MNEMLIYMYMYIALILILPLCWNAQICYYHTVRRSSASAVAPVGLKSWTKKMIETTSSEIILDALLLTFGIL